MFNTIILSSWKTLLYPSPFPIPLSGAGDVIDAVDILQLPQLAKGQAGKAVDALMLPQLVEGETSEAAASAPAVLQVVVLLKNASLCN